MFICLFVVVANNSFFSRWLLVMNVFLLLFLLLVLFLFLFLVLFIVHVLFVFSSVLSSVPSPSMSLSWFTLVKTQQLLS